MKKGDGLRIRLLHQSDIQLIAAAFEKLGWDKPAAQYAHYLKEQNSGDRVVLVAFMDSDFAGYITILWESPYPFFWKDGIPEITDLNVLPNYRRLGIGTQLMNEAERQIAKRASVAGIGVGMTGDYGGAQVLYVKRGYIPDGRGLVRNGKLLEYGEQISIDDSLILYFTKSLPG